MLICPAAIFTITAGIKNGDILRGPPANRFECSRSMISNPPMPEPMNTPTRSAFSGVIWRPDWAMASCAAAKAKWMKRPILRASFFSTKLSGSKFLTSAAKVTGKPVVSNPWMGAIPLAPAISCRHTSGAVLPTPQTSPRPVITTLRVTGYLAPFFSFFSMYSTASFTVLIFSASSSGISRSNASSNCITSSTTSSESAPRSSWKLAPGVTSASSTCNCSTMICFTFSSTAMRASPRIFLELESLSGGNLDPVPLAYNTGPRHENTTIAPKKCEWLRNFKSTVRVGVCKGGWQTGSGEQRTASRKRAEFDAKNTAQRRTLGEVGKGNHDSNFDCRGYCSSCGCVARLLAGKELPSGGEPGAPRAGNGPGNGKGRTSQRIEELTREHYASDW